RRAGPGAPRGSGRPPIPPGAVNCRGCPGEDWRGLAPTGSFPPNPFGLHDMLGNVAEFAADCWRDSHAGRPATGAIYSPCETYLRSGRGAAWKSRPAFVNRYTRFAFPGDGAAAGQLGFRVARRLTPAERGAAGE
ncbi:MAG: formylglycine-generating enzyme family protein, partial [Alphaproteobacteria bacterium]|nr:formylglycine-generating enzyme family protein [Alphaproteobacteria bacterium]